MKATLLEDLADRLRARVTAGHYEEAQAALAEYCRALRAAAAGLPRGDPRLCSLEQACSGLLEQTRRRVLAGRAQAAARLVRLPKVSPSYGERPPLRHAWRILG
jgi:hypothetical protein